MAKKTKTTTIEDCMRALEATGGHVALSAQKLGISFQALYARIQRNKKLGTLYTDIRERSLDLAETKLWADVKKGRLGAICFYLKCQGKHRGWVENRHEITGPEGGPIETQNKKPDYSKLSKDELKQLHELFEKLNSKD